MVSTPLLCFLSDVNCGISNTVIFQFQVINVQVPFLFKLAVDWLTTATGDAGALASFTAANSTALALFATPASVLIGYGIARSGSSAFNGTTNDYKATSSFLRNSLFEILGLKGMLFHSTSYILKL